MHISSAPAPTVILHSEVYLKSNVPLPSSHPLWAHPYLECPVQIVLVWMIHDPTPVHSANLSVILWWPRTAPGEGWEGDISGSQEGGRWEVVHTQPCACCLHHPANRWRTEIKSSNLCSPPPPAPKSSFCIWKLLECLCVLQRVVSRDQWGRLLLDPYLGAACTQSREAWHRKQMENCGRRHLVALSAQCSSCCALKDPFLVRKIVGTVIWWCAYSWKWSFTNFLLSSTAVASRGPSWVESSVMGRGWKQIPAPSVELDS